MIMNILFLGGGRRVSLAKRFIEKGCNIFSYESDFTAPIKDFSTLIKGVKWNHPNIDSYLKEAVNQNKINAIIPLQDPAVALLGKIKDDLYKNTGVISVAPSYLTGLACLDKKIFESAMLNSSMREIYPEYISGKAILKPAKGANSKGLIFKEESEIVNIPEDYVIQSCIDGTEYSVDAYFDRHSSMLGAVSRVRLEVQGGEVSKSIVSQETSILYCASEVGKILGLQGPNCIQFIKEKDTNKIYIMEVNARFGGGVILSLAAGLPMVEWLLQDVNCELYTDSYEIKDKLIMSRYFSESFYYE